MNTVVVIVAIVFGLMLAEARVSRAHERRLRQMGAVSPPGDLYLLMAVAYPASFLAMGIEGAWRAALTPMSAAEGGPAWAVSGGLLFVASKGLKYRAIGTLSERWTFRVLIQPGRPLVDGGPYRFVAHPNYIGVVGELVSTAMMVGALVTGPIAIVVFGAVLWRRVQFESRVLRELAGTPVHGR